MNIVAVLRPGRPAPVTSPPPDLRFETGDTLLGLGTVEQLADLAKIADDTRERSTR